MQFDLAEIKNYWKRTIQVIQDQKAKKLYRGAMVCFDKIFFLLKFRIFWAYSFGIKWDLTSLVNYIKLPKRLLLQLESGKKILMKIIWILTRIWNARTPLLPEQYDWKFQEPTVSYGDVVTYYSIENYIFFEEII